MKQPTQPTHEWVSFENETFSLRNLESGEAMHSLIGPWEEANRIYIGQSRLSERLGTPSAAPLVLYDVGMGLATNVLAAIAEFQRQPGPKRPLRIVSFESDLSGIELALEHPERLPFLAGNELVLRTLLETEKWDSATRDIAWELRPGDFLTETRLGEPAAELIYFDFYSPRTCPELWTQANFERLFRSCARPVGDLGPVLLTYSAGTPVRAALLFAGFFVGRGVPTPAKKETTVAALRLEDLADPLGEEWLVKLERSTKGFPRDRLLTHPQFARFKR
ncbi:MAG: MnmC family methyltransferase [Oligoflexia bacterium]|nr:MnmC family methyltransferase [Oligoflexia bacterium]